jgi:hypothetical protein
LKQKLQAKKTKLLVFDEFEKHQIKSRQIKSNQIKPTPI